jgi:tRNA pseudouridine38-40 synthase
VAFDSATGLPAEALKHLCDHVLPDALRVLRVDEAPPGFDPQRACVRKLYRYLLRPARHESPSWNRTSWRLPADPDVAAMRDAAARLVGTHDFRAFRNDPGPERRDEGTVRTVARLDVEAALGLVRIEAEGPGFLYMMVRNLTAALVEVGLGRRPPEWAGDVLASRDRTRLPAPAPAAGLCLVRVDYDPPWPPKP